MGSGSCQFINSDVGIDQMFARGGAGAKPVTLEDARAASNVGCLELVIPGKDSGYFVSDSTNLALALEYVLTNGMNRPDGNRAGVDTVFARAVQFCIDRSPAADGRAAVGPRHTAGVDPVSA